MESGVTTVNGQSVQWTAVGKYSLEVEPALTLLQLMVEKNVLVTLRNPGNAILKNAYLKEVRFGQEI